MKTIGQYLKEYPNALLKDYFNYLEKENERKSQEEKDSKARREKLLKSYTGKCFRLDFNNESTIFFKLDKEIDLNYRCVGIDAYSIFIYDLDNTRFNLGFEKNRVLNIKHFPNQEEWNDGYHYPPARIISEESFNEIVKYYETVAEITNTIKNIKE